MEVINKPIEFTAEEMELISSHLPVIKTIITNQSCSNLSVSFRQDMKKLGEKLGLKFCTTCSSGIFNLVTRIYNKYQNQINNGSKEKTTRNKKMGCAKVQGQNPSSDSRES